MPEDIFVYFKSVRALRTQVLSRVGATASSIADVAGCEAVWSRRADLQPGDALAGTNDAPAKTDDAPVGTDDVTACIVDAPAAKAMRDDAAADTWLEHYRCADHEIAQRVLIALAELGPDHPLHPLVIGGSKGRHIEHFVHMTGL